MASNSSGGFGFTGLLTVAFIVLKLSGKIAWSWLWVLSPTLISVAVGVVIFIAIAIENNRWYDRKSKKYR